MAAAEVVFRWWSGGGSRPMSFAECRGGSWLDWVGSAVACRGISTVRLWPAAAMVAAAAFQGAGRGVGAWLGWNGEGRSGNAEWRSERGRRGAAEGSSAGELGFGQCVGGGASSSSAHQWRAAVVLGVRRGVLRHRGVLWRASRGPGSALMGDRARDEGLGRAGAGAWRPQCSAGRGCRRVAVGTRRARAERSVSDGKARRVLEWGS